MMEPLFVLLALAILAVVALCVLWPLRGDAVPADRRQHDLLVYRDQLAEVDRDQARGLIAADQAEAARVEIRRRILRAGTPAAPASPSPGHRPHRPGKGARLIVGGLAAAVPAFALLTYLSLGRPDLPSLPFAARPEAPVADRLPALREEAAALSARLEKAPQDVGGWLQLARLQAELGEMDQAVRTVRRARQQAPGDDQVVVELANLLTSAAGGMVTPEARELFEQSLAAAGSEDAADPRTVYFLGVADAQEGDLPAAIERWKRLLARAPAEAPWREQLAESIQVAAREAGMDVGDLGGGQATGPAMPSSEDVAAMAALTPEERADRIRSMVEGLDARLQEEPDDVDGWLRLGRARAVLGEQEEAVAAYEKAAALRPDDPAILAALGTVLITRTHEPTGLPLVDARAKAVFERLDRLAPTDPQPAWFLGLAAAQAGDRAAARAHWLELLDRLPADHPDRPAIEQLVAELKP
ncbi:c-type cytochrome biogenesis protein CcmI [Geminicoccus roseus]|uniref:c-type cytochrome biogenesis protein CcmI n=1 Tax=Geminicoccus roseus TaxID=404900 RepID=UPI00040B35E9|nr:c-type cytochrome biogenesis protein CcmI [Geminicoccus roseus]